MLTSSTIPEGFPPITTGLGSPVRYFPVRKINRVGNLVMAILFFLGAAVLNTYFNNTAYDFAMGSNWSPAGGRHLSLGNIWSGIGSYVWMHGKVKEDKDPPPAGAQAPQSRAALPRRASTPSPSRRLPRSRRATHRARRTSGSRGAG